MLQETQTTVFNTNAQAIVNTVNCVGVMGAGLALEFKLRFPQMYKDYSELCRRKEIKPGNLTVYRDDSTPLIINFPTKNHWKYPSQLKWIEQGLQHFVQVYTQWGITSVAFPKLGCDRGGLNWSDVYQLIQKYLQDLPNLTVYICLDTQTNPQGLEKALVDLVNNEQVNLYPQIKAYLPIQRLRDLQNILTKSEYIQFFELLNFQLQERFNNQYNLNSSDLRLRLILLLHYLGLSSQEISELKINNLVQQNEYILITYNCKKSIIIPLKLWQKMRVHLAILNPEQPLIYQKYKHQKPLKPVTIQKLLSQSKKEMNISKSN